MFILEGSDCLGKSTFAEKFLAEANKLELFPTFYSHMSRPNCTFDFFRHYKDMITDFAVQDRFHLGGIIWHDMIPQPELDIIEGWLRARGSMTMVFYASDEEWYKDQLMKDKRGNLLSIEVMCQANRDYKAMAEGRHEIEVKIDYSQDIKRCGKPVDYPDTLYAGSIVEEWFDRLKLLERLCCKN
jgi:hypothetical protein